MDREYLEKKIKDAFENPFEEESFKRLISTLVRAESFTEEFIEIPPSFEKYIEQCKRIFYGDPLDVLIVKLKDEKYVQRSRYIQRGFVEWYLRNKTSRDAALIAFYNPSWDKWRLSFVEFSYRVSYTKDGRRIPIRQISPTRRFSYLVGKGEKNYTPISSFLNLLSEEQISLENIRSAFSVEKVTEEFFSAIKHALYEVLMKKIEPLEAQKSKKFFFSLQLLSRIMFIYFVQKKGWLKWKDYRQDENYLRNLWERYKEYRDRSGKRDLFYSSWLCSLFFGAFNKKSQFIDDIIPEDIRESFANMPYLNGGLFAKNELDEMGFEVPDEVFEWLFEPDLSSGDKNKGFLEVFNFTVDESMPLDVEVAVDPEMLGKVYESLISEEERGEVGIFYTPRVEIDLMCRLSLIEYLHKKTQIPKEELIDFVFDNSQKDLDVERARAIKGALEKVKIVDPAVGSASFLMVMLNILVDLHTRLTRRIEGKEENLFALKQKILRDNLYGVDVKDWAVMMGELRLWLSLVIEASEKEIDIYTKPLLPNLSFKIRQGDSLVEEIGGIQISLRRNTFNYVPPSVKSKIKALIDKKNDFFSGARSADLRELEEIERFEQEIFSEILQSKINEIDKNINSLKARINQIEGQKDIFGRGNEKSKADLKELKKDLQMLEKEKERYEKTLENLKSKTKKDYFLWEVDFAEVFEEGGFDIVIGNPPYVRQELIAPPLREKGDYTGDEWKRLKDQYKEKLESSVKNIWQDVEVDRRSDLYVYFYYHGLSLLKPGGVLCFISSNSWLDVGYGAPLQEFLLKHMRPIYIIDNLKKRSFKQADVNTVIVLIQRPGGELREPIANQPPEDYTIKFIAFKKPFEEISNAEVFKRIERAHTPIFDDEDFRVFPKRRKELLLEGSEVKDEEIGNLFNVENLEYIGNKWGGKYLRAPEIYFKILEKGKGKLVRLGDIAEIRFGIKTGANEFFYLKPIGKTVKEVVEIAEKNPQALIRVKNGAGWEGEIEAEFLKPVIKSPRELKTIIVRLEDLNNLVFMCHKDKKELTGTKALEYINWGERQGYQNRPTCKARERWWDLGIVDYEIVYPSTHNPSWAVFKNQNYYYMDKVFYGIKCGEYESIWAILNSTLILFFAEFFGYSLVGGGGSFITVEDLNRIPIMILPNLINSANNLAKRHYLSIFTELGFDPNKPIRDQEPNPLPDRKALDDIVFDALGLTEEERKEVYWAVAELVKNRLEKARSV